MFVSRLAGVLPRAEQIHLDAFVLAFTATVSVLASLLFGLTPALHGARADLNETLKEAGRGSKGPSGNKRVTSGRRGARQARREDRA